MLKLKVFLKFGYFYKKSNSSSTTFFLELDRPMRLVDNNIIKLKNKLKLITIN